MRHSSYERAVQSQVDQIPERIYPSKGTNTHVFTEAQSPVVR